MHYCMYLVLIGPRDTCMYVVRLRRTELTHQGRFDCKVTRYIVMPTSAHQHAHLYHVTGHGKPTMHTEHIAMQVTYCMHSPLLGNKIYTLTAHSDNMSLHIYIYYIVSSRNSAYPSCCWMQTMQQEKAGMCLF